MWENASTSTMFVGASKDEILFPKSFLVLTFLSPETPEMLVFTVLRSEVQCCGASKSLVNRKQCGGRS